MNNNCYTFRVLHLKNEQTRGLTPVTIKANPTRIAIIEAKYRVAVLLLDELWQTLLQHHDNPAVDEFTTTSIEIGEYRWSCEHKEKEVVLSLEKLNSDVFTNPDVELCKLIDEMVLDPTAFLRSSTEEQKQAIEATCTKNHTNKMAAFFNLKIENNKIQLQNKSITLNKASQLDLIKLAIAVDSLNNPTLRIIKVNNWLMLNPAQMKILTQIASKLGYLVWITMSVCARV